MRYIMPKNSPSEEPIIDELAMKMVAALRRATESRMRFLGFHTCVCGARSDSADFILPNGLRTNSLCVHYLAHHRVGIEAGELWAVVGLSVGREYPMSDELHGWTPLREKLGAGSGPPRRSAAVESGTKNVMRPKAATPSTMRSRPRESCAGEAASNGHAQIGAKSMAHKPGDRLMVAGLIVSFVGLCVVLVRVLRVPEYWVPLMVGLGLILLGVIRRMMRED